MKFTALTIFTLLLSLIFISCAKEIPDFNEEDVKTPILQEEIKEADENSLEYKITATTFLEAIKLSHKEKALDFLSAIHLGDEKVMELYLYGDTISELKKIKADFEIISEKTFTEYFDTYLKTKTRVENDDEESHEKYEGLPSFECYLADIKMTVRESESEFFPVGVHEYSLKITDSGMFFASYFGPRERYEIFEDKNVPTVSEASLYYNHKFIESFLRLNFTASTEELLDPIVNFDSLFHVAVHALMVEWGDENNTFTTTLDEFKNYIRLRLGYTNEATLEKFANTLTKKSYAKENPDGSYTVCCAHGYSSLQYDLTRIDSVDDLHVFLYTFYADTTHTIPVREMQFTFRENEGSDVMTLRLLKAENLNELNLCYTSP